MLNTSVELSAPTVVILNIFSTYCVKFQLDKGAYKKVSVNTLTARSRCSSR